MIMRIRITTAFVDGQGPALQRGDLLNADEDKALELIRTGFAVAVAETPATRMEQPAAVTVPELRNKVTAIMNKPKGRR